MSFSFFISKNCIFVDSAECELCHILKQKTKKHHDKRPKIQNKARTNIWSHKYHNMDDYDYLIEININNRKKASLQ